MKREKLSKHDANLFFALYGAFNPASCTLLDAGTIETGTIHTCDICDLPTETDTENLCPNCRKFAERRLTNP